MSNPWDFDYFNPPAPHVAPPTRKKVPTSLPEVDRLFSAQDDLIRAINALESIEDQLQGKEPHGYRTLRQNLQNSYRVLNRYLREFAAGGPSFGA